MDKQEKIMKAIGVIIWTAIILVAVGFIAYHVIIYFAVKDSLEKSKKEALEEFNTVYKYVLENKDIYEEFSEYQLSLLDENNTMFEIEREGDMQEMRDVVFKYFGTAYAGKNGYGELTVNYIHEMNHPYYITCYYYKDGVNRSPYGNETEKVIGDNIYISLWNTGTV